MKDLSITQEYMICTVNGKGTISSYNQKSEAGTLAKEMIQHIEALEMAAIIPTMFSNI